MTIDYANILEQLQSGRLDKAARHNAANLLAILGGADIALSDPVDFDPRREFWARPERRLMIAFFATTWPRWPVGEAEQALESLVVAAARWADEERERGTFPEDDFSNADARRTRAVMASMDDALSRFPDVPGCWEVLQSRRAKDKSAAVAMRKLAQKIAQGGWAKSEVILRYNLRWFPMLGSYTPDELRRKQRFFNAYAHAVSATNAYRRAGAQYFGPIIGNTATTTFLDVMRKWRDGKRLADAPLYALGNGDGEPADRSHTNIVRELWGFFNLEKEPFYNNRVKQYGDVVGLSEPMAITRAVGDKTLEWLERHPLAVKDAAAVLDDVLARPERSGGKAFAFARRPPDDDDHSSFDAKLRDELLSAARKRVQEKTLLERAAMALHLALDATTAGYHDEEEDSPIELAPPGARDLRSFPRVWIYAPGTRADRWDDDLKEGFASIGWDSLGDLREYESADEMATKLTAEREAAGRSGAASSATPWQFVNEIKVGDPILARKGRSEIIGYGVVTGPYVYDPSKVFKNRVPVRWEWHGMYQIRERNTLAIQTLAESSRRKALLAELDPIVRTPTIEQEVPEGADVEPYGMADALEDLFLDEARLSHLVELLRRKKNLILQGPPGVGKTFVAKRLAYLLMKEKARERIETVQFHPSYTYEQFVRGYRPDGQGGFTLQDGPLYRIAESAKGDKDNDYVLVIDEINRGNLGKILGEGLMLLEADKRSENWALRLAYQATGEEEEPFYLPPNLHVIGTMNTADRSLAAVDYALRRRFAFVELKPAFDHPGWLSHLDTLPPEVLDLLRTGMTGLNELIQRHPHLGAGFCVGHSYFCRDAESEIAPWETEPRQWLDDVYRFEVLPLLQEYFYDAPADLDRAKALLGLTNA